LTHFLNKFRRITSHGNFIPQVDGLRFLAIFLVVVFHLNGFFTKKGGALLSGNYDQELNQVLLSWDKGVELFFIISGFILALPFASHALANGKKVSLKFFYLRRLTRLEPPYILTMVILFLVLVLTKTYPFAHLFPSLLASLTYTHNVIFGAPLIAIVTWSLEVEIQFYIIAPLIGKIYALGQYNRRLILAVLIIGFPVMQYFLPANIVTLYSFIQYFLLGFLLADLYVVKGLLPFKTSNILSVCAGIVLFLMIVLVNNHYQLFGELFFILVVFLFYYLVLFNDFWKRIFSIPVLSTIGGMCYSIYLWHFAIISGFGRFFIRLKFTGYYAIDLVVFSLLMIVPILLISGLFFLYIEKPCMSKNWHKELLVKFGITSSKAINTTQANHFDTQR
jgi:peptidoglycan/LPS O-acetylase OafA/YrhL